MLFRIAIVLQLLVSDTTAIILGDLRLFETTLPVSNVTVFNAYADQNIFARISFGTGSKSKMNQISYGSYMRTPLFYYNGDYIIQFMKLPTGGSTTIIHIASVADIEGVSSSFWHTHYGHTH